ncbi:BTAD domain-containing putative transcriptional regulator [Nocardia sp. NPDC059240]|uniref:BTAD domain-containing putative transcriptional regulator n=1 Tax=Nocardia sp. NPDC059240 TaxID=3346786 RepID=UPI00369B095C
MEYFLFGPMRVRAGGAEIALGGPKQRAVLAMLLLARGGVVRFDQLSDGLWGEHPPAKAPASLRAYVANLRRLLDPGDAAGPQLTVRSSGYQLDIGDEFVDIHRFEELVGSGRRALDGGDARTADEVLTRAARLWTGNPLVEFAGWSFADPVIERWAGLRRAAVEAGFDAALSVGRFAEVIPAIEVAITESPVHERLWVQLMTALARSGRRAEALQAYDRVREVLDHELGIGPGDELRRLFRELCEDGAEVATDPPIILGQARPSPPRPNLIGRTAELTWLAEIAETARQGRGGLMVLTGESGIGKTTLATTMTDHARGLGTTVAWATHPDGVQKPLLWGWIQLLRELGEHLGAAPRAAACGAAPELITLVPEWPEWAGSSTVPRQFDSQFAVVDGIVRAVREFAGAGPLLLVLDDAHRADRATFEVLGLLADRLHRLPVLVLVAWPTGVPAAVHEEHRRLTERTDISTIDLGGLDDEAVAALVAHHSGARPGAPVVRAIQRRCGGNPFFVREVVRLMATRGPLDGHDPAWDADAVPHAVTGVIRRRMAGLDPETRTVLSTAAVLGAEFDVATVAEVRELSTMIVRGCLEIARQAGMIDESAGRPGWFRFTHGLTRDCVTAQLTSGERAALHAAIAVAGADAAGHRSYEAAIATADHAWRAGEVLEVAAALAITDAAMAAAADRSAYADIEILAQHALQICSRLPWEPARFDRETTLWLRLATVWQVLKGLGHADTRMAIDRAMEPGGQPGGNQILVIAMQVGLITTQGRYREAAVIVEGLVERYATGEDRTAGWFGHYTRAVIRCMRGDFEASMTDIDLVLAMPPLPGAGRLIPRVDVRLYSTAALIFALRGDKDRAWRVAHEGIAVGVDSGDLYSTAIVRLTLLWINAIHGVVAGTAQLADEFATEMSELTLAQMAAAARLIGAWARALGPDRLDTADDAHAAYEVCTADGTRIMAPLYLLLLTDIEVTRGNRNAARELLHRAELQIDASGEHVWDPLVSERLRSLGERSAAPHHIDGRRDRGA